MTALSQRAEPEATAAPGGRRWPGVLVAAGVCLLVGLLAQLPQLRNRLFYVWDDSAVQFLPTWHFLGQRIAAGDWPHPLNLDSWMGGNFAAEALFGQWNPVNVANYLLVSRFSDLALAADVVKTEFLVVLALGCHLLCREYGAGRGPAAVIATALPFAGFTLYYDASSWAAGLIAFAYLPHFWWAARRVVRGVGSPLWAFLFGALAVTTGNPYGLLGVCAILAALLVEAWARGGSRRPDPATRRALGRLVLLGALVGLVVPLVYLPLLGNSAVTWRDGQGFAATGTLMPRLSDFLDPSVPSHQPMIRNFGGGIRLTVPGMYFAWFLVPLLPWLDWGLPRRRWRPLLGLAVVAGGYLLLAVGPSNMWMFRFPLRHVEVIYLAVGVGLAVLLTAGLRTDRWRARLWATAGVLAGAAWLTFAVGPWEWRRHLASLALLTGGIALVLLATRRRRPALAHLVLVAGTVVALSLQVSWFPANYDVADHPYPRSVAELRDAVAGRSDGTTLQVADVHTAYAVPPDQAALARHTFFFGNVALLHGSPSVVSYTGMGYRAFRDALCLNYLGSSCAQGWARVTEPTPLAGRDLLDLMRVRTAVLQRTLVERPVVPPGWEVTRSDAVATVLHRTAPLPWPHGRLSFAPTSVRVDQDVAADDQHEVLRFHKPAGAGDRLVFARLAWPGYAASVNGRAVPVAEGPAGLLVVDLPDGVTDGELRLEWQPPGRTAGIALALLGVLGAVAFAAYPLVRRGRAG